MANNLERLGAGDWVALVCAATSAVGPGGGATWRAEVERCALELARSAAYLALAGPYIERRTMIGRVEQVEDPAVAKKGTRRGEVLDLALVTIGADIGSHADQMWVDRRSDEGRRLIAAATALVGRQVRFVKELQVRRHGDELEMDDGKVKTRPYLAAITELDVSAGGTPGHAATSTSRPAGERLAAPGLVALPSPPGAGAIPQDLRGLVERAEADLGIDREAVKEIMRRCCGPLGDGGRSVADIATVWAVLQHQRDGVNGASEPPERDGGAARAS